MKLFFAYRNLRIYSILGLCLFGSFCNTPAQDITTSTNIYIQADLLVSINGSVDNSGFILNNGSLSLTGNWLNAAIYQGLGDVILTGSDQTINNNRQSFNGLFIRGGGTKVVNGSFTIDRLFNLEDGIVYVSDNDTLRLFPNVEIEGASSRSYVDGALITLGTGYKFFPIGKNGKYHPLELLNVSGIAPVMEAEVHENLPVIATSLPSTPFAEIYWTQRVLRGTYEGSPVSVHYNVPNDVETGRLVMLEGVSFSEQFTARETQLTRTDDLDMIESQNAVMGNIIGLAALAIEPPREHYFSTTLSPNASNPENRVIKIFGDAVTSMDFRFQVFNRWGVVVYETTSANTMMTAGWDGRHNGSLLASGVYPYSLSYRNSAGKPVKRTGFITIVQ